MAISDTFPQVGTNIILVLTNPASAEDILLGKEAIGADGKIIVGTRPSIQESQWMVLRLN